MISEKTELWATDLLLKTKSSRLVFDALACLGAHLVGDMDYCKRSPEIEGVCIIQVFITWVGSVSSI